MLITLPFRLLVNALKVLRLSLEWLLLWPFVLLRRRARRYVQLTIRGDFDLAAPKGWFARFRHRPSYEEFDRVLTRVERDRRVEGILLYLNQPRWALADAVLLRNRLERVRKANKRVLCYFEVAGVNELVVAASADTVFMPPSGEISLFGLKAEITFARDLLAQLGIRGQFLHIGRYKTAGHLFTRTRPTKAQRAMTASLLESLDSTTHSLVAGQPAVSPGKSRSPLREEADGDIDPVSPEPVESTVPTRDPFDAPFYSAVEARQIGLIHHQAYLDQIPTRLRAESDDPAWDPLGHFGDDALIEDYQKRLKECRPVSIQKAVNYLKQRPRTISPYPTLRLQPEIAVVVMEGIIVSGSAGPSPLAGRTRITPERTRQVLDRIGRNPRVKAVVLSINSRGGTSLASDLIWHEVNRLCRKKPVVASLRSVAASGGYFIALPAHEIVAYSTTLTGSIGVIYGKFSLSGALSRTGIHFETLLKSPFATIPSVRHPLSSDQLTSVQAAVRASYRRFVNRVATGRNLSGKQVHRVARGRVYTGEQAKRLGLIDALGTLEDAIRRAMERAEISPRLARIAYYPLVKPRLTSLFNGMQVENRHWLDSIEPAWADALELYWLLGQSHWLAYYDGRLSIE